MSAGGSYMLLHSGPIHTKTYTTDNFRLHIPSTGIIFFITEYRRHSQLQDQEEY